jgi:uncharacterized protein (TIGR03032 family)
VIDTMTPSPHSKPELGREIRYVASDNFVPLLDRLRCSILISTYHAGRVVAIGVHDGKLVCDFHCFELAMGMALHPTQFAVGTRHDVVFLQSEPRIAPTLEPAGRYDACFLTRKSIHTGTIAIHEMAFLGDELWVVNTLFSCLATVHERFHFVPRWKPKFISELKGPEDRCHLNGMAIEEASGGARVRYVSCLGESNEPQGWRPNKATGGILIDVPSQEIVSRGLCMPHSPRLHAGRLWVLDSGRAELQTVDPANGQRTTVERFPGYPRGLTFHGPLAFVALSRIRETSVFDGIPIAEHRDELKCGLAVVDLERGRTIATFQFFRGVEELFDVKILPNVRCPALRGPNLPIDEIPPVWVVPPLQG